jgi:class 3 adenylate cyclase/streptogramin lyase
MQRRGGGRSLGAVLFTDIVGSTAIAADMGNTRWAELVARHHRIIRRLIGKFDGNEVDTAGDGFFVTFERPADAIRCAVAAEEAVRELGIEIRAGISFGELETVERKAGGLVVNTAARVMAVAGPGEVLVPASVKDIVPGSGIAFVEHGVHQLKGFEGEFRLFKVTDVDGRPPAPPLDEEEAAGRRREIFPAGRRRGPLIAGLAVGALAVIVGASLLLSGGQDEPRDESGPLHDSVARIEIETGKIRSPIFVGNRGNSASLNFIDHPLAVGEGGVWLLRPPALLHIDPIHQDVRPDKIEVALAASQSVVTGFDAVWILTGEALFRVNPATDELHPFLRIPISPSISTYGLALGEVIWVGQSDGTLIRLDPATSARDQVNTGSSIDGIAATRDGVWIVDVLAGGVIRFDTGSLRQVGEPIQIRGSLDQIVARGDAVWVLDRRVGIVTQIDALSNTVNGSARVGDEAVDMAVGADAVWVADRGGALYRVDASTLEVSTFPVGAEVLAVAVDDAEGSVWVYVGDPIRPSS